MNYTLNQLQIFLKIVQTQSVTKAAEELYLTQPAVSIQLKNFQEQFDIPLTEVVGRRIYVTEFGYEVAKSAEKIFEEVYAINYKTLAFKGQLSGRLKISIVSTGKYVMPYFLTDFVKMHPGIDLQMDVSNRIKVKENLENNEIDFALISMPIESMSLNSIDLFNNELYLVGNQESEEAPVTNQSEWLASKQLIFREAGSGTRQAMEQYLDENKINIRRKFELTSNEAIKQAVKAGLGYSIMPQIGIKSDLNNKSLKIITMANLPIITTWKLVWIKTKNLSPVASAYVDYLEANKASIAAKYFL